MKIKQSKDKFDLGVNIRALRLANKYTQEQVVAKLQLLGIEISRGTYSQIECGISHIKVEVLLGLCKVFHCEPNDFFEGIELKNPYE